MAHRVRKTFIKKENVRDCEVIRQNDCAPALAGLHNGSARASELQAASIEMHKLGNSPWWMTALVPRPARCKARHVELGCARRFRFAAGQGWQPSIDFFASACNRLTDRYISWSNDPACESWMCSRPDPGIQVNAHTVSGAIVKLNSSSLRTVFRVVWLEG